MTLGADEKYRFYKEIFLRGRNDNEKQLALESWIDDLSCWEDFERFIREGNSPLLTPYMRSRLADLSTAFLARKPGYKYSISELVITQLQFKELSCFLDGLPEQLELLLIDFLEHPAQIEVWYPWNQFSSEERRAQWVAKTAKICQRVASSAS